MNKVKLDNIVFGDSAIPFIGGPCVIESRDHCLGIAEKITEITSKLNIPFVFKSSFDKLCQTIAETAFTSGYVNNYNDPLILLLNLKTNRNYFSIEKIQKSLFKYFKDRLLGSKYSFQKTDMSNVPINQLMGKVLIFTSGGYENTSLEELINFSWDKDNINKISYKSLSSNLEDLYNSIKLNINDVRETNKNNLTLVVPNEDAFFTNNYNTDKFFISKCQMIAMNYQYFDDNMKKYIQKFKTSSFILNQ